MARQVHLTPEQARYERAKAERATFIVSLAIGDKELMQEVREAYEASEKNEGVSWEEFCRREMERRRKEAHPKNEV